MLRIIFILLLIQLKAFCQSPPIYFLSVGSGHYNFSTPNNNYTNYEQLPEAVSSARIMSTLFQKYGKAKGVTLLSTQQKLINKNDILTGMDKVWDMIQADKADNPLVILYLSGHGFADSILGSQFLLSGNYPSQISNDIFGDRVKNNTYLFELIPMVFLKQPGTSFKDLDKMILHAADDESTLPAIIAKMINFKPVRLFIMMDCCRNTLTYHSLNPERLKRLYGDKTEQVNAMYTTMLNQIKIFNDNMLKNLWPVIFSGNNMEAVSVVPFPPGISLPVKSNTDIAPLCRKTLLMLNEHAKYGHSEIDLETFIRNLVSPNLDNPQTPVTYFNLDKLNNDPLFKM